MRNTKPGTNNYSYIVYYFKLNLYANQIFRAKEKVMPVKAKKMINGISTHLKRLMVKYYLTIVFITGNTERSLHIKHC